MKTILNSIDYSRLKNKHFLVKEISALKAIGLEDSIRWLYNAMIDYSRPLENQIISENSNQVKLSYVDLV